MTYSQYCLVSGSLNEMDDNDIAALFMKIFWNFLNTKELIPVNLLSNGTVFQSSCTNFLKHLQSTHTNDCNWDKMQSLVSYDHLLTSLKRIMENNTDLSISIPPPIIPGLMDISEGNKQCQRHYKQIVSEFILKIESTENMNDHERISQNNDAFFRIVEIICEYHHFKLSFWSVYTSNISTTPKLEFIRIGSSDVNKSIEDEPIPAVSKEEIAQLRIHLYDHDSASHTKENSILRLLDTVSENKEESVDSHDVNPRVSNLSHSLGLKDYSSADSSTNDTLHSLFSPRDGSDHAMVLKAYQPSTTPPTSPSAFTHTYGNSLSALSADSVLLSPLNPSQYQRTAKRRISHNRNKMVCHNRHNQRESKLAHLNQKQYHKHEYVPGLDEDDKDIVIVARENIHIIDGECELPPLDLNALSAEGMLKVT